MRGTRCIASRMFFPRCNPVSLVDQPTIARGSGASFLYFDIIMIIPIGVDCGTAMYCKKYNLRHIAFPFDWNVTYNGVSACIADDFRMFTKPLANRINQYDVYFHHDFESHDTFEQDTEKYTRRCDRLVNILATSREDIVFCRKGHAHHHHHEHDAKYSNISSDIDDAEKLDAILANKYPCLRYKIIVILVCGQCFDPTKTYKSVSNNIEIYNIATPHGDDAVFEKCFRDIFKV